ncbi:MAG: zf-HC2 domain-containing protein, partial [Elusimicrobiota bacterium]
MNKCKFEKARLKYIYGELSNSDIASFEKHLQGCPLCKEELSFSKSLSSFLKNNLAYGSPSQETISTIKEAGDEVMREITSMESAGVRVIWRYAFGTVGIVLVLSVILFYQRISVTEKTASPVFET